MSFPKRWLDPESDASGFERALLGSEPNLSPDEQDEIWASLSAKIALAGGAALLASGAKTAQGAAPKVATVAKSTSAIVATKVAGVLFLTAGAFALGRHFPAKPADAPVRAATQTRVDSHEPPVRVVTDEVATARAEIASPSAPPHPRRVEALEQTLDKKNVDEKSAALAQASTLHDESAIVIAARAVLRSGNRERAVELLNIARDRYPDGALAQEREALAIEAMVAAGDRKGARLRAGQFVSANPGSPYADKIRALLDE